MDRSRNQRRTTPTYQESNRYEMNSIAARRPIKAVTFDVGGTLIECWPSVGHIYAEVAARHGHTEVSPDALNANFRTAWTALENFNYTPADWSALVDATFAGLIKSPPSQTFFPELFQRFSEPAAWRVFDDVPPTLRLLKERGVRLGIISNWDDRLRLLLQRLSLYGHFETIVISCEAGWRKPARQIFERACSALNTHPEETLHVGDSYEMDFLGARAAGLQARWLRRGDLQPQSPVVGSLRNLDKL
jgi:putative hydrolase of the HAD superfamily